MPKRLLVNDCLTCIPGTRTFWHDLMEWFECEFVGGDYATLAQTADASVADATLIIRNATWFPPIRASERVPTISLIQDIFESGPQREMQNAVALSSRAVVFNSEFTKCRSFNVNGRAIPLPVDFTLFEPGNALGLQQAHSLPDGCVCWIGAQSEIKGYDIFLSIVRQNPDISFVAVFKDAPPEYGPPNMRIYSRLPHDQLVSIIGACRVGLCTSRVESQHLAGIEMGACGLPMMAPPVGCYWKRDDMPGVLVAAPTVEAFTNAVRAVLSNTGDPQQIRAYWEREFSKPVVRAAWTKLVAEVECSGQS